MDRTIAGALIAAGFAVVGFAASAWTNLMTVRATQQATREQRPREKRSGLYEALLDVLSTSTFGDPDEAIRSLASSRNIASSSLPTFRPEVLDHFHAAGGRR
jgi:hypothetical protein